MTDSSEEHAPPQQKLKLTVSVSPSLGEALANYAEAYCESYGREETIADLIPALLAAFLESDREFCRRKRPPLKAMPDA